MTHILTLTPTLHAQEPHHGNYYRNVSKAKNGPSRQRRRERRAESRKHGKDTSVEEKEEVSEEVIDNKSNDVKEVTTEEVDILVRSEPENTDIGLGVKIDTTEKVVETPSFQYENEERCDGIENKIRETEIKNKDISEEQMDKRTDILEEVSEIVTVTTTTKPNIENTVPPIVTINATAVIDNSPNSTLTNEDVNSIFKILRNKEHLANNIVNFEYSYLSTREFRQKFKHTVGLAIFVQTCNLWEGARSYIYRHTGRDSWALRNGSEINITRIHQR